MVLDPNKIFQYYLLKYIQYISLFYVLEYGPSLACYIHNDLIAVNSGLLLVAFLKIVSPLLEKSTKHILFVK